MRTEERLRQAERNGDIQTQVRMWCRILDYETAKVILAKASVIDIWPNWRGADKRLKDSLGNKTHYKCPHCLAASEYAVLSSSLLQCPNCKDYYLDSARLKGVTSDITPDIGDGE